MTLRLRLALTIVAAAIPLVAGYVWLRGDLERQSMEDGVRSFVVELMENGGREACEADPAGFPANHLFGRRRPGGRRPPEGRRPPRGGRGGRGGGPERRGRRLTAYYPDFTSANERAPEFPTKLREQLEDGADTASEPFDDGEGRTGHWVALRMEWNEGPCAIVLVRHGQPPPVETTQAVVISAVAMCGFLMLAVLLAAGPLVRRIRKLTADVREADGNRHVDARGRDEIGQLGRAFNEAFDTIQAREQTLRSFVANTTHDVMLPLTVLQGHLTEMRKRAEAGEPTDRELVLNGLEEAHYLGALVHNLNVAAKLETGSPHIERHPVDLNELINRVVTRHRPVAEPRGISVEFAVPETAVWTDGDVTLIEQAVNNVVHNAVRYNETEGGHVILLLEEIDGARFRLRVIDDGPGIGEEDLARLTERRFRGNEARTRHPDGMGLGLHIAHDVAAKHGFDFALRASEHGGLEVELVGPVRAAS